MLKCSIITIILFVLSVHSAVCQPMTLETWNEEAKTNIRLFPKYGHAIKTQRQKEIDEEFIVATMKQGLTRRSGSARMIEHGFKYLYKDVKTAMYRFNQAYLLDSNNSDIYWGFGGVYMVLGDWGRAKEQYQYGLKIAPGNPHLLTDYGTYFLMQYYRFSAVDQKKAGVQLDSAVQYLNRSYKQDSADPNTCYKLSVVYLLRNDCKKAKQYYDRCLSLDTNTVDAGFTAELRQKCH